MTNRNHKVSKKKLEEKEIEREDGEKEKIGSSSNGGIITTIISLFAVAVSIVALCSTSYYEEQEYKYKREPEVEMRWVPAMKKDNGTGKLQVKMKELHINIIDENNLDEVYFIRADKRVDRLVMDQDNIRVQMETDMKYYFSEKEIDLVTSTHEYSYQYVFLRNLDGSYRMYLAYLKTDGEVATFNVVSGIQVYGLENSDPENPLYEGERIMAKHYREIMSYVKQYGS